MSTIKKSKWESDEEEQETKPEPKRIKKPIKSKSSASPSTQEQQPDRRHSPAPATITTKQSSAIHQYQQTIETTTKAFKQPTFLAECRHVDCYERLNHIEEGSYGVVFRARDRETGDIVALKKLKLEKEKNGFPVTSLREIYTLMNAKHPNIVNVREIVMGNDLDK